ncbi:hypothetical protein NP233_g6229 [Leucocoprinus birnbaumii]|uniref:Uncharacterized protein n=1 Tax=Leucocoprinus birnbaumii TaxID=56174 RepID=A0AAD5YVZ2_9AGAR|nr:hypothetical protein NP233_g6229 [Leucocoprinus birnbaumii]
MMGKPPISKHPLFEGYMSTDSSEIILEHEANALDAAISEEGSELVTLDADFESGEHKKNSEVVAADQEEDTVEETPAVKAADVSRSTASDDEDWPSEPEGGSRAPTTYPSAIKVKGGPKSGIKTKPS